MPKIHFCDDPQEALCGYPLIGNNMDFKPFYDETTNSFAHVSCSKCREVLKEGRLKGWPLPKEWNK